MNKSFAILLILVLLVILLTAEIQLLVPSFATPSPGPDLPTTPDASEPLIRIISPEPGKLYNEKNVPYSITIEKPTSWIENHTGYLNSVGYVLDGETNVTIPDTNDPDSVSISVEEPGKLVFTQKPGFVDLNAGDQITIEGNLSGLAEGNHTIQVWISSTSVYHPADTPQNFYGWWKAVAEVPLATSSGVVHFSVTNKAIDPENTPAIFAAASIKSLSTAVIGIGLLVYVKKHKRKAESQMKKTALALAFLLLFSFALAAVQLTSPFAVRFAAVKAAASPRTIIFPDDHPTIQAAIDDASEGDTIFVRKGVYVENPVVNKSVSLIGEDRNLTVIDVTAGLKVQSNNVTIAGFTIYDGYDGISLATNYCNISGNKITNTTHGIVVFGYENSIL